MFRITQDTPCRFTFAEVLLMAAMNQVEAKRNHPAVRDSAKGLNISWGSALPLTIGLEGMLCL